MVAYALHAMLGEKVNNTCQEFPSWTPEEVIQYTQSIPQVTSTEIASTVAMLFTTKSLDIINMTMTSMTNPTTSSFFNFTMNTTTIPTSN